MSLRDQIRAILIEALARAGTQRRAAAMLEISPRKLNYMMKTYGIPRPSDAWKKR